MKYPDVQIAKLPALRPVYFETLPACPGHGYVLTSDGFTARYLPGRNVVIVEASYEGARRVIILQIAEWSVIVERWLQLRAEIDFADSPERARAAGLAGIDWVDQGLGVTTIYP